MPHTPRDQKLPDQQPGRPYAAGGALRGLVGFAFGVPSRRRSRRHRSRTRLNRGGFVRAGLLRDGVLVLGATGLAIAAGLELGEPAPLAASTTVGTAGDSDGDGIGNLAELLWGMDPLSADSDSDGYGDLDEIALGTDPTSFDENIDLSQPSVGIITSASNGFIVARVAFYVPDGNMSTISPKLGLVFEGSSPNGGGIGFGVFEIPSDFYLGNGSLVVLPSIADPSDRVAFCDMPLPQEPASKLGWLPIFATVGPPGGDPVAAAVNNIVFKQSIPFAVTEPPAAIFDDSVLPTSGTGSSGGTVPGTSGGGGGIIYLPLLPPDALPPTSTKGEICYQDLAPVGVLDGVVQYEIITSDCFVADSYCSADCPAEQGAGVGLYDPLALIGG